MEAITHLSFEDDTILLSSTRWEEIEVFERILRCFAFVSGLKINLSKSLLVGVRCSVEVTTPLANLLHCKVGKLPMTCLAVRIGAKSRSKAVWRPVVDNFEQKLSSWTRNYPSSGGRITLIKAFLSNLPVYFMSLLLMLVAVGGKLDHLRRDFLWEGRGE